MQCFDDTANYFLNCSKEDSTSWPGHTYQPCNMVSRNLRQINPPSSYVVFESAGMFQAFSPSAHDAPYNSSNFEYGFSGQPRDTWTSTNAGFAAFRWNLARDLLIFDAGSARASIITSKSTIEAGYCIFYPEMQVISARAQNGLYEERIINSTTLIQPYFNKVNTTIPGGYPLHQIGLDEVDNITYTYQPSCQPLTSQNKCNPSDNARPVNITIPRQRYLNLVAAIGDILPNANVSTSRQTGLYGSGFSNPEAVKNLYMSPNITTTMHTITHYVSVALRANDTILAQQNSSNNVSLANFVAPSHRVAGTVYVQIVLLHVR